MWGSRKRRTLDVGAIVKITNPNIKPLDGTNDLREVIEVITVAEARKRRLTIPEGTWKKIGQRRFRKLLRQEGRSAAEERGYERVYYSQLNDTDKVFILRKKIGDLTHEGVYRREEFEIFASA